MLAIDRHKKRSENSASDSAEDYSELELDLIPGATFNSLDYDRLNVSDTDEEGEMSNAEKGNGKRRKGTGRLKVKKKPRTTRRESGVSSEDFKAAVDSIASAGKALANAIRDSWKLPQPDSIDHYSKMQATLDILTDMEQQLEDAVAKRDAAAVEMGEAPVLAKARVSRLERAIKFARKQHDHYSALFWQGEEAERIHE